MIRLLVRLGAWLDKRFPEKVVVTTQSYKDLEKQIDLLNTRMSVVEGNAVHKGAVQDLIQVVKGFKDEIASLKVGMGLNRIGDSEIRHMLNGEPITQGDNENG